MVDDRHEVQLVRAAQLQEIELVPIRLDARRKVRGVGAVAQALGPPLEAIEADNLQRHEVKGRRRCEVVLLLLREQHVDIVR